MNRLFVIYSSVSISVSVKIAEPFLLNSAFSPHSNAEKVAEDSENCYLLIECNFKLNLFPACVTSTLICAFLLTCVCVL